MTNEEITIILRGDSNMDDILDESILDEIESIDNLYNDISEV